MFKHLSAFLLFILILSFTIQPVSAQASGPVYVVQSGDTLVDIADFFNLTLDELMAANPAVDPNFLAVGQQLVIPGLEGVTGILEREIIPFGDNLRSLRRRTQVSDELLVRLNRLVSPTELYVGASFIIPTQEQQGPLRTRIAASSGESLLELAVKQGSDPWTLASVNKLDGTWDTLPGDILYSPIGTSEGNASGLPSAFLSATIEPLPLVQGSTEVIRVRVQEGASLSGALVGMPLHFFQANTEQVALQGIHALREPGVYPFLLEATFADGSKQSFEQMLLVTSGDYSSEDIPLNDPSFIDPVVTEPEFQNVIALTTPATPARYWTDTFTSPATDPNCFTSWYGTRRTYRVINTETKTPGFHTGLDFCGGEGLQIFAPAPGTVVFAAPLTVRGNATIIDHGWGVYSGFWHQSEILVNVGETVAQGQVIGVVGGTGRVTGAHLHWELWVNGVQVNPLTWLDQAYP
jgi:murein DD-endopeptidase MepM/ murein hydrolase activator NlpD